MGTSKLAASGSQPKPRRGRKEAARKAASLHHPLYPLHPPSPSLPPLPKQNRPPTAHLVVRDLAVPQHVVDGDEAAAAHEAQAELEVAAIGALVGVDKGKVEGAGGALGVEQPLERLLGGREARVDLCFSGWAGWWW